MTMTKQSSTLFSALAALADEIKAPTKKASDATPGTDPGGITGPSTHPSADAASDNGSEAASEGSRSSENEKDVKTQIGAPGVNSGSGANGGSNSQDNAQLNIGATQSATGEDPKVEDAYKDKLPDPGTTHPAQVGKEKYSSMKIAELQARATELGNAVLADIANGFLPAKQAAAPAQQTPQPANTAAFDQLSQEIEKAAALVQQHVGNNPAAAAQLAAGYQLASSLQLTKEAAQRKVAEVVEAAVADGCFDADLFGAAYQASLEQVKKAGQKRAAGEEAEGNDHDRPGDSDSGKSPTGGEDAASPVAAGGGGGGLSAMLGGGGGAPDAGAAPSKEEILQEILSALAELGIPLEELAAAGAGGAGGAGGMGGPPAGGPEGAPGVAPGGAPLPPPDMGMAGGMPPDEGMKLAAAARAFQRSGKYQLKTANPGSRERHLRDDLKKYILEIPGIRK